MSLAGEYSTQCEDCHGSQGVSCAPTFYYFGVRCYESVQVGVFVGLLLSGPFSFSLLVCTSAGVLTFLLSLGIHLRYYWAQVKRKERDLPVHFPSQALSE